MAVLLQKNGIQVFNEEKLEQIEKVIYKYEISLEIRRMSMFAVLYRFYIIPGAESDYQRLWNQIVNYFIVYRGAIGSCLHKAEDGLWLAYSRWPDKAARDASWPGEGEPSESLPEEIKMAIVKIKTCIDQDRKLPEIWMEVVDDSLLKNALSFNL